MYEKDERDVRQREGESDPNEQLRRASYCEMNVTRIRMRSALRRGKDSSDQDTRNGHKYYVS